MRLYHTPRSSAAYRVRIALNLCGLAVEMVPVDLVAGEQRGASFRDVSPAGLVPALVLDDGTVLTQSLAILRWLDSTRPEPLFFPADPLQTAAVESVALAIACDIHPLNNLRVLTYLERDLGADAAARDRWYAHWMQEGLRGIEASLARGDWRGPFAFGAQMTAADLCIVPQLFNARRFKVPLDAFPVLRAIDAHCTALPPFAAAAP